MIAREIVHRPLFYKVMGQFVDSLFQIIPLVQNAHSSHVEPIKIELIRVFYRLVQSYSDSLEEIPGSFDTIISFALSQLSNYDKERHQTILISMDFLRIVTQQHPKIILKKSEPSKYVGELILLDVWEPVELTEIIELFAQQTDHAFTRHSYTTFKPSREAIAKLDITFQTYERIFNKLSSLPMTSSILYCLYHICGITKDDKLTHKTLQLLILDLPENLKIFKHFVYDCPLCHDDRNILFQHLKYDLKLVTVFIKMNGKDVDKWGDGKCLLEANCPLENITPSFYRVYAEYIAFQPTHPYALKIIPHILSNIPKETTRQNVEFAITALSNIIGVLKMDFQPFYEKFIDTLLFLLNNCLISVGFAVLTCIEKFLIEWLPRLDHEKLLNKLLSLYKKEMTEDKKILKGDTEDLDLESEINLSLIQMFSTISFEKYGKIKSEVFEQTCELITEEVVFENDDEERLEECKLAILLCDDQKHTRIVETFLEGIKSTEDDMIQDEIKKLLVDFIQLHKIPVEKYKKTFIKLKIENK
jgi:hypothetical protein